jgi:hypothetical protein
MQLLQYGTMIDMEHKLFLATVLQYVSAAEQKRIYSPRLASSDIVKVHLGLNEPMRDDYRDLQDQLQGKKSIEFKTVDELMAFDALDSAEILDLDIEMDTTPTADMANPLRTIVKAADHAFSKKKEFQVSPSKAITDAFGVQFSPYCEYVNLQAQSMQDDRERFKAWVNSTAKAIKNANQNIRIFAQLSTQRPPISGFTLLATFKLLTNDIINNVNGMTIWFDNDPASLGVLEAYLDWYDSQPYRMTAITV